MLIEYKTEIQRMLSHSTYHAYRVQDRDTVNVVSYMYTYAYRVQDRDTENVVS